MTGYDYCNYSSSGTAITMDMSNTSTDNNCWTGNWNTTAVSNKQIYIEMQRAWADTTTTCDSYKTMVPTWTVKYGNDAYGTCTWSDSSTNWFSYNYDHNEVYTPPTPSERFSVYFADRVQLPAILKVQPEWNTEGEPDLLQSRPDFVLLWQFSSPPLLP